MTNILKKHTLRLWLTIFCLAGTGYSRLCAQEVVLHDGRPLTVARSLELAAQKEAQGDAKEASRFLNIAASLHWEHKEYEAAARLYQQSLMLNRAIGNANGMTMIHNNLGMIYADTRAYEQALFHFEQTLAGRREARQKISMVAALINLSVVLNNLKRHAEAVRHLDEALRLSTEMNDARQMRSCYGMMAETYEKMGDQAKTLEYFNLYRTFHELEQRTKEQQYTQQAAQARLSAQLAEAARRNQALELSLKQRQLAENRDRISAFGQKVQQLMDSTTKQELALAVLKQENKLKELILSRNQREVLRQRQALAYERQLRTRTASGLAVAVLLLAGVLWLYVQKRQANQEIRRANQEMQRQNAEIIGQADHISQQARQLQESNALKDKLFSIVSHDMRGPLGSLKSVLGLVTDGILEPDEFYALSGKLKKSVEGLHMLMENLLHWAQAQMDGVLTNPSLFDINMVIEQVHALYARTAEDKDITLLSATAIPAQVFADQEQVHLIVRNLVGNALKFTPAGGQVRIQAETDGGILHLRVQDTGVGIPADKAARLFSPATHGSEPGTAGEKGTGLGLMLCKEFAERNGGRIRVESEPGHGSTFCVELPASLSVGGHALQSETIAGLQNVRRPVESDRKASIHEKRNIRGDVSKCWK